MSGERSPYNIGMKRTKDVALTEVIRVRKIQSLRSFFGQNLWQGDLAQMREDRPAGGRLKTARHKKSKS
jgi:hypothetical protein